MHSSCYFIEHFLHEMPRKNNFTKPAYRQTFPGYPTDHLNIHQNLSKVTPEQKNNDVSSVEIEKNLEQNVSENSMYPNFIPNKNIENLPPTIHSMDTEAHFKATTHSQEDIQHQEKLAIINFDPQETSISTASVSKNSSIPSVLSPENLVQALPEQNTIATTDSSDLNASKTIPKMHARNSQKITITYSGFETPEENSDNSTTIGDRNINNIPNERTFQGLSNGSNSNLLPSTELQKISENNQNPPPQCYMENYKNPENSSQSQPSVSVSPQPFSASLETPENGGHYPLRGNDSIQGNNVESESFTTEMDRTSDTNKASSLYKQQCFEYNGGGYVPPQIRNQIAENIDKMISKANDVSLNKQSTDPKITESNKMTENRTYRETNSSPQYNNSSSMNEPQNSSGSAAESNTSVSQTQKSNSLQKDQIQPSFSEKVQGTTRSTFNCKKILRMKVVPPFRKEHFQYPQLLEQDVAKAIAEIASIFHPNLRNKVTISRTNISQPTGRKLQILMVTAPGEAEEDVAQAKTNGITIMGKTVFPTGDEFWRFSPGEFPKRAMIHINNLPVLMETEELEEVLSLPEPTNRDVLERETLQTEAGTIHSGRARIPLIINSKEHENALLNWSLWRNSDEGLLIWNEVPIYMTIPRIHKCRKCEEEGRQYIGHDEKWCRINRKKPEETPPNNQEPIETHSSHDETPVVQPEISNVSRDQVQQSISTTSNDHQAPQEETTHNPHPTTDVENGEDMEENTPSTSSSDDDNEGSTPEKTNQWQQVRSGKKRKRKKKSTTSKLSQSSSINQPKKKQPADPNTNG